MDLMTALEALVREWEKEMSPGTSINSLLEILANDTPAAMSALTSSSPPGKIANTLMNVLMDFGDRVMEHAQNYADNYSSPEELLESEGLEGFLTEIAPVD